MNRREFFTSSWKAADEAASRPAMTWIRPPFALDESAFLAACTACGDCLDACPHQVVFPLPEAAGKAATGTPALDLLNRGCHLCRDWPCVTACDTGALELPVPDPGRPDPVPRWPELALAHVEPSSCLAYLGPECGACAHSCPVDGALVWHDNTKPVIDPERCIGCGLCREACIVSPKAISIRPHDPAMP